MCVNSSKQDGSMTGWRSRFSVWWMARSALEWWWVLELRSNFLLSELMVCVMALRIYWSSVLLICV
jgi:hypothetical protein